MPIRGTFEKFRRLVHDLARDLGKNVELTIEGADTELDKTVIEQLGDPLMHLIRNSMDHGIEPARCRAAQRQACRRRPSISSARHSGASVLVSVTDDGRGIDAEAVRRRAIEKGLIAADAQLTESRDLCAALSARLLDRQTGHRCLRPRRGHGRGPAAGGEPARRRSRWPASRAGHQRDAAPAADHGHYRRAAGGVGDACFVLPLASTLECIELTRDDIARANGKHLANVRGEMVPYIRLREHFHDALERAGDRTDHAGRNRRRPLRICGGPGAGQLPDGDQEPGPVLPPGAGRSRAPPFWATDPWL